MQTSPSIDTLHTLLVDVALDVKDLKTTKIDATLHAKDIEIIELKMTSIERSVDAIRGYAKIITTTVVVAVLGAVLQSVLVSQ